MKIKQKVLILLLGCFALLSSCQEELLPEGLIQQAESSVGIPTTRAEINQAQDWYGENHPEKAFAEVPVKEGARIGPSAFVGIPDWEAAGYVKMPEPLPIFISVPMHGYRVNAKWAKKMNPFGCRYLVIREDGNGSYYTNVAEFHPDVDYLNTKGMEGEDPTGERMRTYISNDDYTGYMLIYTLDNQLIFGERRENGRIVSRLQIGGK